MNSVEKDSNFLTRWIWYYLDDRNNWQSYDDGDDDDDGCNQSTSRKTHLVNCAAIEIAYLDPRKIVYLFLPLIFIINCLLHTFSISARGSQRTSLYPFLSWSSFVNFILSWSSFVNFILSWSSFVNFILSWSSFVNFISSKQMISSCLKLIQGHTHATSRR